MGLHYDTINSMNITSSKSCLSGSASVPGSKSHTIRALLLAALAEGTSHIENPLPSADCLSTAQALPLIGAELDFGKEGPDFSKTWTVKGAGKNIHLPTDVVNVGNSGSLLYFLSPIAATFKGYSIFTGDQSIRKRPVHHVVDALNQLGAKAACAIPDSKVCPLIIQGPISNKNKVVTEGSISSQYISGLMMAALLMEGTLNIELTNPKETPYLTMTQKWLEQIGAKVSISEDFKQISVTGPYELKAFDTTIPSDWEAVSFPLVAGLISDSDITIKDIDGSGTQGDEKIVEVLQNLGGSCIWNKKEKTLRVKGSRLSTEKLAGGQLHVNLSGYPDAICALAVAACFTEGSVYIEDISVCRRKETDRIKLLVSELGKLGADLEEGDDYLVIHGHSPLTADGNVNPAFTLHGGTVNSYDDHRAAMAFSVLGMGLPQGSVTVTNAECCKVSFPDFYQVMEGLGAHFTHN